MLFDYDIVEMILSYLRDDPDSLSRLMRVSPVFFAAGARFLWASAKPTDLLSIQDSQRRSEFAAFIKALRFWTSEDFSRIASIVSPAVWHLEELDIAFSGTHALSNQRLAPFLVPTLKNLNIWSNFGAEFPLDNDWLAHISASCRELTSLSFSIELDISDIQLSHFFSPLIHLKSLHIGGTARVALAEACLSVIFTLPKLKTLILVPSISHDLMTRVIDRVETSMILPNITSIDVIFSNGDSSAPGMLLQYLTTLRRLTLVLNNTTERASALHPTTFASIGGLRNLTRLSFSLGPNLDVTDGDIAALHSLHNLTELNIWSQGNGITQPGFNVIHISDQYWRKALAVLQPIKYVRLDLEWRGVLTSYEDGLIFHHNLPTCSRGEFYYSHVTAPEASSSEWPTAEDYAFEAASKEDIWKASLESFSPDPITWEPRDLNRFVDDHGNDIPIEDVAANEFGPIALHHPTLQWQI